MRLRKIFKSGAFSVIFSGKTMIYSILLILLFSVAIGNRMQKNYTPSTENVSGAAAAQTENPDAKTGVTLIFRSFDLLDEHFEKHGRDMGFTSTEEYLAAANEVVYNTASLHKKQSDGDDVYFLQETDDLVVVSTDGYIRTYFRPEDGIAYYNRQ
jgi:pyocin large subunit-like protein